MMEDHLRSHKLKNYLEKERFPMQDRHWLQHCVFNRLLGGFRGLKPGDPTRFLYGQVFSLRFSYHFAVIGYPPRPIFQSKPAPTTAQNRADIQ